MHKIKHATTADIPLIRELTFQVWPQTYAALLTAEQLDYMLEMMYSEVSLEKQMNEGARFILVYDDDKPVGFASFQHLSDGIYKLHKLYVLTTQQGKGTGRFMIESILAEIKPEGAIAIRLQVNKNNKAKDFYTRLGFEIIEDLKLDIGNGFFMDDFIMEKKIG